MSGKCLQFQSAAVFPHQFCVRHAGPIRRCEPRRSPFAHFYGATSAGRRVVYLMFSFPFDVHVYGTTPTGLRVWPIPCQTAPFETIAMCGSPTVRWLRLFSAFSILHDSRHVTSGARAAGSLGSASSVEQQSKRWAERRGDPCRRTALCGEVQRCFWSPCFRGCVVGGSLGNARVVELRVVDDPVHRATFVAQAGSAWKTKRVPPLAWSQSFCNAPFFTSRSISGLIRGIRRNLLDFGSVPRSNERCVIATCFDSLKTEEGRCVGYTHGQLWSCPVCHRATGFVPSTFGNLQRLEFMDLRGNIIEREICDVCLPLPLCPPFSAGKSALVEFSPGIRHSE